MLFLEGGTKKPLLYSTSSFFCFSLAFFNHFSSAKSASQPPSIIGRMRHFYRSIILSSAKADEIERDSLLPPCVSPVLFVRVRVGPCAFDWWDKRRRRRRRRRKRDYSRGAMRIISNQSSNVLLESQQSHKSRRSASITWLAFGCAFPFISIGWLKCCGF